MRSISLRDAVQPAPPNILGGNWLNTSVAGICPSWLSSPSSLRAQLSIIAFSAVGWSYLSNFSWVAAIWRSRLLPSLICTSSHSVQADSCTEWRVSVVLCCYANEWSIWLRITNVVFAFSAVYCFESAQGTIRLALLCAFMYDRCPHIIVVMVVVIITMMSCADYLVVVPSLSHDQQSNGHCQFVPQTTMLLPCTMCTAHTHARIPNSHLYLSVSILSWVSWPETQGNLMHCHQWPERLTCSSLVATYASTWVW